MIRKSYFLLMLLSFFSLSSSDFKNETQRPVLRKIESVALTNTSHISFINSLRSKKRIRKNPLLQLKKGSFITNDALAPESKSLKIYTKNYVANPALQRKEEFNEELINSNTKLLQTLESTAQLSESLLETVKEQGKNIDNISQQFDFYVAREEKRLSKENDSLGKYTDDLENVTRKIRARCEKLNKFLQENSTSEDSSEDSSGV